MPEKFKQKLLYTVINAVFTLVVMFIILATTSLGNKADIPYVDKKDTEIQKNLDDYRETHTYRHVAEYKAVQDKLDIIIIWIQDKENK